MRTPPLTFNTRKSLANHLGESAGSEISNLIMRLIARVEQLERNKVDVTPIVPGSQLAQDAQQQIQ